MKGGRDEEKKDTRKGGRRRGRDACRYRCTDTDIDIDMDIDIDIDVDKDIYRYRYTDIERYRDIEI
jgi:hypothetical protein